MISRETVLLLANIISNEFTESFFQTGFDGRHSYQAWKVKSEELRDFLFSYNLSGFTVTKFYSVHTKENLKKSILDMTTGIFYNPNDYNSYISKGQEEIKLIAVGLLRNQSKTKTWIKELENNLKIDGYIYQEGKLFEINSDISEKTSLVLVYYERMKLSKKMEFEIFYNNMNDHYENSKWEDSIHNGRKLYELTLSNVAQYFSEKIIKDNVITSKDLPVKIRTYLENNNFFSVDESNIIQHYYKYISNIGSHPKLALKEQADFCRILTINICLYALVRLDHFESTIGR